MKVGFLRNLFSANAASPEDPGDDDTLLVAQARQGDAQAFALLYHRYCEQVYDFAFHRLGSREAAEDVTQTVFLRVVTSLPKAREETYFAGWLFAIARNEIVNVYRKQAQAAEPLDSAFHLHDTGDSLEEIAERAEWSRELGQLRERCLNGYEQEVFDLRMQGLSDREIAVALGRSHGAIRTMQYRLVTRLRDCVRASQEAIHAIR
jgi:RNA polymerase sigma-70 factor, ECF subfamily